MTFQESQFTEFAAPRLLRFSLSEHVSSLHCLATEAAPTARGVQTRIPLAILSLLNELPAEDPYLTGLTVSIEGEAISSVRVTERARLTWSSGILDSARR